ncbi:MAG: terminase [Burkholderiales bacterium]
MTQDMFEDRNAMSFRELLSWAWGETPPVHKSAANLLIHLFAVPLFVFAHFLLIAGILVDSWLLVAAIVSIVVSLVLQKFGHSLERNQVFPFAGPRDFLRRLYAEQFCNFWRFLFSGQWYANFKARDRNA